MSGDRFVLKPEDVQMHGDETKALPNLMPALKVPPRKAAPKKATPKKRGKGKPLKTAVHVLKKPTGKEPIPGVEVEEKGMRGTRYVRTYAGQQKFGQPIGSPIHPDVPDGESSEFYRAYTMADLEETYGKQRWVKEFGGEANGTGKYAVRLMADGDVIITYANDDSKGGPEDHVIWMDGIPTNGDDMRELMDAFNNARTIADEWVDLDQEEMDQKIEDEGLEGETYVDTVQTRNGQFAFGIYPTGEIDVGPPDDNTGGPDESHSHTLTTDQVYELQDALDDAWTADISGEGLDDEEEEDDEEDVPDGFTPWFDAERNVGIVQYEDGEPQNNVTFTQDEGRQLVAIYDEFLPIPTPDEDAPWIERTVGPWVISMGPNAEINFYNESQNLGMEMEFDDFEHAVTFIRSAVSQQR